MLKLKKAALFSIVACSTVLWQPALAQGSLGGSPSYNLRNPLIQGAPSSPTMGSATEGQPPPTGMGSSPPPVVPGMSGAPTVIPSIPTTPANDIANPSYQLEYDPNTRSAPGTYGSSASVPPPPSTPGEDPGMLHAPRDYKAPPARQVNINPEGGISGSASTERWGGQTTADFGRYKTIGTRKFDYGQELQGSSSKDAPGQVRTGAVGTQDLYGRRRPVRNNGQSSVQTIAPY